MSKYQISRVISKDNIANVCHLSEALYYLAFNVIPVGYKLGYTVEDEYFNDIRCYGFDEESVNLGNEADEFIGFYQGLNEILSNTLRNKYSIEDPFLDETWKNWIKTSTSYFKQSHNIRNKKEFRDSFTDNVTLFWRDMEPDIVNKINELIDLATKYEGDIGRLTDESKVQLYGEIKNKNIKLFGSRVRYKKDNEKRDAWDDYFSSLEDDDISAAFIGGTSLEQIDPIALKLDKIDWLKNCLIFDTKRYHSLIVDFKDILKIYPLSAKKKDTSTECSIYGVQMVIEDESVLFRDKKSEWSKSGGDAKSAKTTIIKREVIKPLFLNKNFIRGTSVRQQADYICSIFMKLDSLKKKIHFANKYNINIEYIKKAWTYLYEDADSPKNKTVYEWCRLITNGKL